MPNYYVCMVIKVSIRGRGSFFGRPQANTACTRPPEEHRDYSGGSRRVFRQFAWLEVGSGKVALSRPTHQRVTRAVGQTKVNHPGIIA